MKVTKKVKFTRILLWMFFALSTLAFLVGLSTNQVYAVEEHTHDNINFTAWTNQNSLPSSGNYFLATDVSFSGRITVSGTLNLCLNGHGIKHTGNSGNIFYITTGNTLNLYDCDETTEHKYTVASPAENGAGFAVVNDNATGDYKTFTGGYITGGRGYETNGYALGAAIQLGYSSTRGGVFNMYGGTIIGNKLTASTSLGGGVYVKSGGTFNMYGGALIGNEAKSGATLFVEGLNASTPSYFNMYGGAISGNTSSGGSGGGIYVSSNAHFLFKDGEISNNFVSGYGGGIYFTGSSGKMDGGVISGNIASKSGGSGYGGGLNVSSSSGTFTMNDGEIKNNIADRCGGVRISVSIYNTSDTGCNFIMNGGSIANNAATYKYGETGGVAISGSISSGSLPYAACFTMKGGEIKNNRSESGTGGVKVEGKTKFVLEGGSITGNVAAKERGGVYVTSELAISGNPVITGNTDKNGTSNLYLYSSSIISVDGELDESAHIGLYKDGFGVFTSGLEGKGSITNFVPDDEASYFIRNNEGEAEFVKKSVLTYHANGSNSGSAPAKETYMPNSEVTIKGNEGELTKKGRIFDGWNTKSDGSGDTYREGDVFEITQDTTLYALWIHNDSHDDSNFVKWTATDSLPTEAGDYYLTACVTITSTWNVPTGVTKLCLNGFGIKLNGNGSVINVDNGATLYVYDCYTSTSYYYNYPTNYYGLATNVGQTSYASGRISFNGGYITGGNGKLDGSERKGGAFYISNGGQAFIHGGTISGNSANYGGAIFVASGSSLTIAENATILCNATVGDAAWNSGAGVYIDSGATVYMTGGSIRNNYACGTRGGGVQVEGGSFYLSGGTIYNNRTNGAQGAGVCVWQGSMYVSGNPQVRNNWSKNDNVTQINVYIHQLPAQLYVVGELNGPDGNIGITLNDYSGSFTSTEEEYLDYNRESFFVSDKSSYIIITNDYGQLTFISANTVAVVKNGNAKSYFEDFNAALNAWADETTLTLLKDISISSTIVINKGTKTLDLNGHGIKMTGSSRVFYVDGATFILDDSNSTTTHKYTISNQLQGAGLAVVNDSATGTDVKTFNGGYVTGANTSNRGAAVCIENNGLFILNGGALIGNTMTNNGFGGGAVFLMASNSFVMNGGAIIGNTATSGWGGGIYIHEDASFTMNGGVIKENYATKGSNSSRGGGISAEGNTTITITGGTIINNVAQDCGGNIYLSAKTTKLSGTVIITGGKLTSGTVNNVHIDGSRVFQIEGELSSESSIGLTCQLGAFTSDWNTYMENAEPSSYFTCDVDGNSIHLVDGEANMCPPHSHVWQYSVKDNTITATCIGDWGCDLESQTITITADSKEYDEAAVAAVITMSSGWLTENGLEDPASIVYSGNTTPGTHTASITIGEKTASIEFTITCEHDHGEGKYFVLWKSSTSLPTTAGSWVLTEDVIISNRWDVPTGTTNLCLNGHSITRVNGSGTTGSVIQVGSGATLNLYDCDTQTRYYVISNPTENGAGLATIVDESTYNVTNANARGTFVGGYITGGTITGAMDNAHLIGGGVNVVSGSFTMYGGTIIGNKTCINSGAVKVKGAGASFTMNGGALIGNYTDGYGGAISIGDNNSGSLCAVTINDGLISKNYSERNSGAIHVDGKAHTLAINGGRIINNYTGGYYDNGSNGRTGGGTLLDSINLILSGNPVITDNINGGGLQNDIHIRFSSNYLVLSDELTEGANIGVYYKELSSSTDIKLLSNAQRDYLKYIHYDMPTEGGLVYCDGQKDWMYLNGEFVEIGDAHHSHEEKTIWATTSTIPSLIITKSDDSCVYFSSFDIAVDNGNWVDGSTLKLLKDVTTASIIIINDGSKTLDLNGYGIRKTGSGRVFTITNWATLTLIDSNPQTEHRFTVNNNLATVDDNLTQNYQTFNGGYITGGNAQGGTEIGWGGCFCIGTQNKGGTLNIFGGTLIGNHCDMSGGAMRINSNKGTQKTVFYMTGGSIIYNTSSQGGAVSCENDVIIRMSGGTIENNFVNSNKADVYLEEGQKITVVEKFSSNTSISILLKTGTGSFTDGWLDYMEENDDPENYFKCNDDTYVIRVLVGEVGVWPPHSHNWEYTAKDNVITANCIGEYTCDLVSQSITITAINKDYDSKNVVAVITKSDDWDAYGLLEPGDIVYSGNKNVGTYTASITINNATATVEFTISPIPMSGVSIAGYTGDYDGTSHGISILALNGATVKYGTAANNYTLDNSPVYTNVGTYTVYYEITKANYITISGSETVKIDPIDTVVTITGNKTTVDYNGVEQTISGYVDSFNTNLYTSADYVFNGAAKASRTVVGTTYMGLTASQFVNTNTNFKNVTFVVTDGYITIKQINATVMISGYNNSTDYDGNVHTISGYKAESSISIYDVNKDFIFNGTAEASRTSVGTTYMGLEASQFVNTNTNFAQVTFVITDGYVMIYPANAIVTITGNTAVFNYNGKAHTVSGYTAISNTSLYDVSKDILFIGVGEATRTDAGTTNIGLEASQFVNMNTNFAQVAFNVTDGFVKVNPIDVVVTITGNNDTVDYDGTSHTVNGYVAVANSSLYDVTKDFAFNGREQATRTDAGTSYMSLRAYQFTNVNHNFATVTFDVTDGFIKINPIDAIVTITGNSDTLDYDGKNHSVAGYIAVADTSLYDVDYDFMFSGNAKAFGTDADTYNMELDETQFTNTNANFKQVTFEIIDGFITINPIDTTVTITGNSGEMDYDGKAHTVNGYVAVAASPLYDVTSDFTFSGKDEVTGTDADTHNMGLNASQFTNTNANFKQVTFEITDGFVKINPIDTEVTIIGKTETIDYDGKSHTASGYVAVAASPLYDVSKDFTFNGGGEATGTNVGTVNMGLNEAQFINTSKNFKTVTFKVTDGSLIINPIDAAVTITGNKDTVNYDGKAHTVTGYTVVADKASYNVNNGFVFSGKAETTGTNVGSYYMGLNANQFTNTDTNFKQVTFNIVDGFVTINPVDVTITIIGNKDTINYDGKAHTISGYTASANNGAYNVNSDFVFSGTAEITETNAGSYYMGLNASQFVNKNDNFGKVTFNVTDGFITIKPVNAIILVAPQSLSPVYDEDIQPLVSEGEVDGGTIYYALTKASGVTPNNNSYSTVVPTAKEIGEYYVWYKVIADANHNDLSPKSIKVIIKEDVNAQLYGVVYQADGKTPQANVTLTITKGKQVIDSTVTGDDGKYSFAILKDIYNIVAEYETITETVLVSVFAKTKQDIVMPDGKTKSLLSVDIEDDNYLGITAGGLNQEAYSIREEENISEDKSVTIEMTIEIKDETTASEVQSITKEAGYKALEFFEIKVNKTVDSITTAVEETLNVLEIVIPYEKINRHDLSVYSYHGTSVKTYREIQLGDTIEDGTFYLDKTNGYIHVYSSSFSTFAIGYTPYYKVDAEMSLGVFTGKVNVTLESSDGNVVYTLSDIDSGKASFANIPMGEYIMTITWEDGAVNTISMPIIISGDNSKVIDTKEDEDELNATAKQNSTDSTLKLGELQNTMAINPRELTTTETITKDILVITEESTVDSINNSFDVVEEGDSYQIERVPNGFPNGYTWIDYIFDLNSEKRRNKEVNC